MATLSELRNLFRFGSDFTQVTPFNTFQTTIGQNILEQTASTSWTDLWNIPGGGNRQHQDFNAVVEGAAANTTGSIILEGSADGNVATAINLDYYNQGAPTATLQVAISPSSGSIVHYSVINPLKLRYVRARISVAFTGTTPGARINSVDYSAKHTLPQILRTSVLNTVTGNITNIGGATITANAGAIAGGTQRVIIATGNTGTLSSVTSAATATSLLTASSSRVGVIIYNESTSNLFLLLGTGTVSATNYTTVVAPNSPFVVPDRFTALKIDGIWATANGSARITVVS